jgi:hypothetical protein
MRRRQANRRAQRKYRLEQSARSTTLINLLEGLVANVRSETATVRAKGLEDIGQLQAIMASLTEVMDNIGSLVTETAYLLADFSRMEDRHSPSLCTIPTPTQSIAGDAVTPAESRNTVENKDQRLHEFFPF